MDTLVYTDCRPGQGLRGTAGLQFQARSAGADPEAMALVQRALLYEPPANWMRERRPVADYPPSFAHAWDRPPAGDGSPAGDGRHAPGGWLATAAGVYLGREANGNREGNQLTHAVVTRDPADYGPLRPAQLFGAPFWRAGPAEGTESPTVDVRPGPLDAETVQEFVRADPDGVRRLAVLLTALRALGRPDARRVLFVAADPGPVLTWVAAGTLLLPQRTALAVGFKIFTTHPAYAEQHVLAVHPDAGPVPTDDYLLIDLTRDAWPAGPLEQAALGWAELFAAEDPYDVTDAVEIAGGSGLPPAEALALGGAVLGHRPADGHLPAVVRWLVDGAPELVEAYGPAVVDTVATDVTGWPAAVLADLDRVTRDGRFPGRAADVRIALLTAELRAAVAAGPGGERGGSRPDRAEERDATPPGGGGRPRDTADGGVLPVLAGAEWTVDDADRAADVLARALDAADGPGFDAVLRVATRFGLAAPLDRAWAAVDRFVEHWAGTDGADYDPARWPDGGQLTDLLCDHLVELLDNEPYLADAVGDRWWLRLIGRVVDPTSPLDRAVVGAAMVAGSPAYRMRLLGFDLDKAGGDRHAAEAAVAALWRRVTPTAAELELVRDRAPAATRLSPTAVDRYVRAARGTPAGLRAAVTLCQGLTDRALLPEPGPDVEGLLADDAALRGIVDGMAGTELRTGDLLGRLATVAPDVIAAHGDALVAAMVDCRRPALLTHLVPALPPELRAAYHRALAGVLRDGARTLDVLVAALLRGASPARDTGPSSVRDSGAPPARGGDPSVRGGPSSILDEALVHWLVRADEAAVVAVADELDALGDRAGAEAWTTWADETRRNRGIKRFLPRRR
ncbi:GTPase-associated protein 1-related protein [Longispora sp. K20-0274]|uniref:GTPase-associated protein 1-related protein n=1 Tax=Longispora sp. K20-0274 TaxID=3088255 RepID=UPI00399ACC5E